MLSNALFALKCNSNGHSQLPLRHERSGQVNTSMYAERLYLVVGPDCRGLPPPVVPAGVAVVELEAVVVVPAREQERDAERPKAPELCVRLN